MSPFAFVGKLEASKSMLIRLSLVQSYFPYLKVIGESQCDDVRFMRKALSDLFRGFEIDAGSSAAVLRFMALRASRVPGRHRIVGSKRLFERPHDELSRILLQLGVQSEFVDGGLNIESAGWKLHGDTLLVPSERSSQFASAVLLNAWELPFEMFVSLGGKKVSEGYWRMSVQMAQQLGMKLDFWDADFRIPKGQKVTVQEYTSEIDLSSAFAIAAIAAVSGSATLLDFPRESLQPDAYFTTVLSTMGVPLQQAGQSLKVDKALRLNGVAVNLKSCPDLFPVLAALCALAEGDSELFGAPHLVHKESNRLARLAMLIQELGRNVERREDGMRVTGPRLIPNNEPVVFDCDHDHRLAFAAAVFKAAGFPIEIKHGEVVNKSFPEFWRILGWTA